MNYFKRILSNEYTRNKFVEHQLSLLPVNSLLLDAGCGSQQYKKYCSHIDYRAQDFGKYKFDVTKGFTSNMGGDAGYEYGQLDYIGNIWNVEEVGEKFDAILCTEVFEHIPFPTETITEFARLLKPGGKLILTVPSNCLRHMDPYFFYSGFSNRFLDKFLVDSGFKINLIEPVGDYYSWIAVELARTIKSHSPFTIIPLGAALLYFMLKRKTPESVNTLCMGYHVVATKA